MAFFTRIPCTLMYACACFIIGTLISICSILMYIYLVDSKEQFNQILQNWQ